MKFRTEIDLDKSEIEIEHNNRILTLGSCFAENISEYFKSNRFTLLANPFGVLYNPVSIFNSLKLSIEKKEFCESDLIFYQSEWHSFYHHSNFSNHNLSEILTNINIGISTTHDFLKSADIIIITFGTSYVFNYLANNTIVSNCHKVEPDKFKHYRLSYDETLSAIKNSVELVEKFNPKAKFILTVSPVRHWKNGAHNNQLSKANLLFAIDEVVSTKDSYTYFPSYEILMDDLRDYRFYNSDLLHPNKIAIDYIWNKFSNSFCSNECLQTIKEISKIVDGRNHRVRNIQSDEHQKFVNSMIKKIEEIQSKYQHLSLAEDLDYFQSQRNNK